MATTTGSDIQRHQSLIPYLQGVAAEARLKLDLFPWGARQSERYYPFALIDDSHPLSRLLEARFVTDGGFTLKKVLLQVQKDRYSGIAGRFDSAGNGEIDAAWTKFAVKEGEEDGMTPLACDQDGAPVPLAPLFYCREKGRFFPPLCPACGVPLTLCTDEPLLERFGLAPYRTSLKRYLHCGSCSRHGLPEFYRYDTEPDDPVTVQDRWTLMERFRLIDSSMDPDGELPCIGCAGRDVCFGAQHEARRRIVPFSFYPFHLLMTDLPTLYGSDYLHLLSGAEPGELAERLDHQRAPGRVAHLKELADSGRGRGTLYAPGEERFFPEVLFLKLTLMSEILRLFDPWASSFGLDRVMVRLPHVKGELPVFWNCSAQLLREVTPASGSLGRLSVLTTTRAELALCWIQLLCGSREVGPQEIHAAISRWLENGQPAVGEPMQGKVAEILRAENLFWQPSRQVVGEKWLPLWERACAPALKLLGAARDGASAPSVTEILAELGELRGELKRALFPESVSEAAAAWGSFATSPEPPLSARAGAAPPPAAVDTTKAVRAVPERLKAQARREVQGEPAPVESTPSGEPASAVRPQPLFDDDETMETVIFSPGPSRPRGAPLLPPVDICETRLPGQPPAAPPEVPRGELLETMVAPGSRLQPHFLPPQAEGRSEGGGVETAASTVPSASSPFPPSPPGAGVRGDDVKKSDPEELTETIFVRPQGGGRPGGR